MNASAIDHIQQRTREVLHKVIGPGSGVALLDFPNHANAGDVLIYRGQLAYLSDLGCDVQYLCAYNTYDQAVMEEKVPNGPILLQGGGSFGDRYRVYQEFRERVIAENPHRKIIQMPQTFEFSDPDFLARTRENYTRHPDLTILIRHQHDLDRIAELFPENRVEFCPDAAFGAGRLREAAEPDHDLVIMKRVDTESLQDPKDLKPDLVGDALVTDWRLEWFGSGLRWWPRSFLIVLLSTQARFRPRIADWSRRSFDRQSEIVMDQAIRVVSRGRVVVTDRLHGAIFGLLLGKPVVLVDNANRKVSAAHRDYFSEADTVHLTDDFDAAVKLGRELARSM
ncbi:polysaccharide pyruvyl transferase family protein [Gordonia alkanivorans]|uniref:polysaccharide pyruvyl transferase family protein n=1 Tax=Gordonia alkanivorans TaxID=84096 RepID=UPI002447C8FB|nr:polysaccharide pyruvyl transferase family protein [Gordonia alkanivorans]MDH3024090.1 polysaccharide pyruvyl transferase family protein [Gordonia alkanivorans]MDJ0025660.1 polysaccharide pyruvyl transferase family protein [Gordonia alkanivorans]